MDFNFYGIKFSKFILAFKKAYRLTDTTYDYMSFLKATDCASHCALMMQYKNPNDILNFYITPELNSIDIVGGGKKMNMKGGGPLMFLMAVLFSLGVGGIYAGDATKRFITQYGEDPRAWPTEPIQPIEPESRWTSSWFIFSKEIKPSQEEMARYYRQTGIYSVEQPRWQAFEKAYKEYLMDLSEEDRRKQQALEFDRRAATMALQSDLNRSEADINFAEAAKIKATADLKREDTLQLIVKFIGTFGLLGVIYMFINFFKNTGRTDTIAELVYAVDEVADGQRSITDGQRSITDGQIPVANVVGRRRGSQWSGGKSKNYRKKRTTRRRRQ